LTVRPVKFSYTALSGAAWTSWIVGVVAVLTGLSVSLTGELVHRRAIPH
jgi:hypothetical protein